MSKSKVAIPLKMHDLIWLDDVFYREIESNKKFTQYKFPRCDQWCDERGFHLAFALAGYSPNDILIKQKDNVITISNINKVGEKHAIQHGMIIRGIAKRNFNIGFVINSSYAAERASSRMKNGLLEVFIPEREKSEPKIIKILGE